MSQWTHTLTIIVPESLIAQANRLALAVGTSEDDVNTFTSADWTDGTSNFAVCSTRAVDKIFDYVGLVDTSENVMLAEALSALSFVSVTTDGDGAPTIIGNDSTKIRVLVDVEPLSALAQLGLIRIANDAA